MTPSEEVDQVVEVVGRINPLLAGLRPEVQGAILADLLATFLAGHFRMGAEQIERVLAMHVSLVQKLVPTNIAIIKRRLNG